MKSSTEEVSDYSLRILCEILRWFIRNFYDKLYIVMILVENLRNNFL